jgi:DNA-directed RNA polymerase subunit RPC12/RpoP
MDTLSLHCARCDAPLDVPSDRSEFYCSYCGTKLQVNRDVGGDAHRLYEAEPAALPIPASLQLDEFGRRRGPALRGALAPAGKVVREPDA